MESRNIFDINLPSWPKSSAVSVKRDVITQNEGLLAEKKATLAKLKKQVEKAQAAGHEIDACTLKRIEKLQEIIRNIQQTIDREKERLAMLMNGQRQY